MDFKDLVQVRRSHRKFTEEEISGDDVKMILRAALMAPTSKSQRAWQFVVRQRPRRTVPEGCCSRHRGAGRPSAE